MTNALENDDNKEDIGNDTVIYGAGSFTLSVDSLQD